MCIGLTIANEAKVLPFLVKLLHEILHDMIPGNRIGAFCTSGNDK